MSRKLACLVLCLWTAAVSAVFWAAAVVSAAVFLPAQVRSTPVYYANSSSGSDSNNGLTPGTAWQTIAHVNAQTLSANATVFLSGTFTDGLVLTTSVTPGPIVVTSYGTSPATITSGNSTACVTATNVPSVVIRGIICTGGGNASNTTAGISIINSQAGNTKLAGPTIANVTVSQYGSNGIEVKGTNGYSGFNGITIANNTVHDVTGTNTSVSGFLQGTSCINVFSYTGFGGGQSGMNPPHTNVTISGNTVFNCNGVAGAGSWTGSGITVFQTQSGLITKNVAHDIGANVDGGHGSTCIWIGDSDSITISYNESYNGHTGTGGFDGDGFDFDEGTTNSLLEYNFSHDNVGHGILTDSNVDGLVTNWGNNTIRFNITQNNLTDEVRLAATGDQTGPVYVHNNTFYAGASGKVVVRAGTNLLTANIANNILYGVAGATIITIPSPSSISFLTNDYYAPLNGSAGTLNFSWNGISYGSFSAWQTATGQEKISGSNVGLTSNPQIYVPGGGFVNGGYVPNNLMAYNLQSGSAMVGAGLNVQTQFGISPGPTDYYGAAVSASSLPVGAAAGDFSAFVASSAAASLFLSRVSSFSKLDNVNYNSLLSGLISDGNLSHLDFLHILAAPNSAAAALNLLSTSYSLTTHGTVTFGARQGYHSNGTTGYLDTLYTPSTAGGNMVLASGSIGAYDITSSGPVGKALIATTNNTTTELSIFTNAPGFFTDINDFNGITAAGVTVTNGMFIGNRAAGVITGWFNGVQASTRTLAPVALVPDSIFIMAENGAGTANQFTTDTIAADFAGDGGMNLLALSLRINSFMTAYGINVY